MFIHPLALLVLITRQDDIEKAAVGENFASVQ